MSDVPAPRPLTADPTTDELLAKAREVSEDLDQAPWNAAVVANNASDVIDGLVATVEHLQAEVARLTADLDTARKLARHAEAQGDLNSIYRLYGHLSDEGHVDDKKPE